MTRIQGAPNKESAPTRSRYAPADLAGVPEVAALLGSLGLGAFDPDDVTSRVGRNDNWAGTTTTGARVFVKRLRGPEPAEARSRYDRILAFEALAARHPGSALIGPSLLGSDSDAMLVVFEFLEDARSGSELNADDAFDEELSHQAGRLTGELHALPADADLLDTTPHPMPPLHPHNAVSLRGLVSSTFGELETWRLIQSDGKVVDALHRLRAEEAAVRDRRPIHGDLRLDQFLLTPQRLLLTDWEEFRLGDPARDLGAVIGEWLYTAIHGIPRSIGDTPGFTFDQQTSHQEILEHGVRELDRLRPRMRAFWAGYRSVRGAAADDGLRIRAASYAGWHMFDRMLATAMVGGRVIAADRAGAGIGRSILLAPESSTDILGLGDAL
ncbi:MULTISPECIES: class V lanthionine synthetase subunit LxmK [unclassified Streptomyces]|uniref:class V lanthionine synthetase subunit LxmK n=1 Tax=unclassified Streptomyces TaxID=2593676 RepID=UPI003649B2E6